LLPEKFVPWQAPLQEDQVFLPEILNSLQGLPIYDTLTQEQKFELCRHEAVQVMYSYSWSVGLFCLFMNRYVLNLPPDHRKGPKVAVVLQKMSELHNIEEARHILFTQALLKRYTNKAGFLRRSAYSIIVLLNVYFMRKLYVKKEIFERIGLADPEQVYKMAYANYRQKFAQHCLHTIVDFVAGFNGFNWLTRPLWKLLLNASDHAR
jgi:hypothetical protein